VFVERDPIDKENIYEYNYEATKKAIERAMKGEPKVDEVLSNKD
jgi:5,6,7,8-tetrahydromethanopterin hydro-lyase